MFISPTADVFVFDVRVPSVTPAYVQLDKPFVSICSPFFSKKDGKLFLINERQGVDNLAESASSATSTAQNEET